MRRVLAALLLLAASGCASAPPRPTYYAHWHVHGRTAAPAYRHTRYRHPVRHRIVRRHHAWHRTPHLAPGTFDQQTRRRCAAGDSGACRMLRAMDGG